MARAPQPDTVLHDDLLGLLRWNPALDWWEGGFLRDGFLPVGLSLSPPDDAPAADTAPLLAAARALVARLQDEDSGYERDLRQVIADKLLPLRLSAEWQTPDSPLPPPTRDAFAEILLLEDSIVYADGTAELFYNDGGLFEDHTILATLDETGALLTATLGG